MGEALFMLVLSTCQEVILALIIILLILLVWILLMLRKLVVTVPLLSMVLAPVIPPGQYDHGATVAVAGIDLLDTGPPTVPAVGNTVNLNLTDKAGTVFPVGSAVTDSSGAFSASFAVPAAASPGDASLTAIDPATGATATVTFTLNMRRTCRECDWE